MILGVVVMFGLLLAFGIGMTLLYLSGWVSVTSTPEHLVISRRETNRYDPPVQPVRADWAAVRAMEWQLDGRYYHHTDGTFITDASEAELEALTAEDIAGMTMQQYAALRLRMGGLSGTMFP